MGPELVLGLELELGLESRLELGLEEELELVRGWEWGAASVEGASKWVSGGGQVRKKGRKGKSARDRGISWLGMESVGSRSEGGLASYWIVGLESVSNMLWNPGWKRKGARGTGGGEV